MIKPRRFSARVLLYCNWARRHRYGDLHLAVAHGDDEIHSGRKSAGKSLLPDMLLDVSLDVLETARFSRKFEDITSQFQPMPKILEKHLHEVNS